MISFILSSFLNFDANDVMWIINKFHISYENARNYINLIVHFKSRGYQELATNIRYELRVGKSFISTYLGRITDELHLNIDLPLIIDSEFSNKRWTYNTGRMSFRTTRGIKTN